MYRTKKMELYMYNSKTNWSYTCITRKNGVIHVQLEKKMSYTFLYIPTHYIFFAGFGMCGFKS